MSRRLALALALLLPATLPAAPAPEPKAAKPAAPPTPHGEQVMRWGGLECRASFVKDWSYACLFAGEQWAGFWSWDEATRKLTVNEWRVETPWNVLRWSVVLDKVNAGEAELESGGRLTFSLAPATPAPVKR